jgi:hypothetical protein
MPVSTRTVAEMLRTSAFLVTLVLLAVPCALVRAQKSMTIYRCVDPSGAVTLQNDVPCPKGSQQSIRNVGVLPTLPAPPAAATLPAAKPKPSAPPTRTEAVDQAPPVAHNPPPPLFQCRTWDERDYFGETGEPPASCVPVESVGIDGSSELAAGSTCEMRQDACTPIPAEQLCASWKKRMDEAEFRWKFGGSRNDGRKVEFERVAGVYRQSTCLGG